MPLSLEVRTGRNTISMFLSKVEARSLGLDSSGVENFAILNVSYTKLNIEEIKKEIFLNF